MDTGTATSSASAKNRSRVARVWWWLSPWRVGMVLAFGVFTTFVAAWGCALLTPAPALVMIGVSTSPVPLRYHTFSPPLGLGRRQHIVRRGIDDPSALVWLPESAVAPGELELVAPKVNAESWVGGMTTVNEVRTYVYGLPFPSMRWWSDFPPPNGMAMGPLWMPPQPIDRHSGLLIAEGTRTSDAKMLPLGVCWGPFAKSVAYWVVLTVASVELNAAFVRWRRRRAEQRRGACPHCGYDRKGLEAGAVCPECGKV